MWQAQEYLVKLSGIYRSTHYDCSQNGCFHITNSQSLYEILKSGILAQPNIVQERGFPVSGGELIAGGNNI